MRSGPKRTILFISPGPTFRPGSEMYQNQYLALSKSFTGYILTRSSTGEALGIGNFTFKSIKFENSNANTLKFIIFCIWTALKLKIKGEKIDLVATYDPLKTGLIGLTVSRILRSKLAPEVNGVYTSPAVWLDVPPSLSTKIKRRIYPLILAFVLKHADGIKLLFEDQIDPFRNLVKAKVIQNFPCYVPVEDFRNIREDKEVLFVGFPFKIKGVDILIQAFKKVAPNFPDWKLKILGWYPALRELDDAIAGHPQIYHHKPVQYNQMVEHIGCCAILVLPSRSEAMGRVLVEAMAAGKPRIGARVDGIPTVIEDGVDGLLFEPENIDDLADKLDSLMGNPDLRVKFGNAGRARARRDFSQEIYINNLSHFYNDVMEH